MTLPCDDYPRPSDAAITEAQGAYERGEMSLLEAVLYAEVLDPHDPDDEDPS